MFPRFFPHLKGTLPPLAWKELVFHFIVVLGAVDHHKKPHWTVSVNSKEEVLQVAVDSRMLPRGFPHQKGAWPALAPKKIGFSFYSGLGAVGLAQVATTRSHIEQSLSIPRKNFSKCHWFLECSSGSFPTWKVIYHVWLEKSLVETINSKLKNQNSTNSSAFYRIRIQPTSL